MNRRKFLVTALGGALLVPFTKLNLTASDDDNKFNSLVENAKIEKWNLLNINEINVLCGKYFIGLPYIGGTLEGDTEVLRYRFDGFDCVTLYETSLALARNIKKGKLTIKDFENELTYLRYRKGEITGYPSRLHYTSEWIIDNVKKNVVEDITKSIGGKVFKNEVNFMSNNPKYYKELQNNQIFLDRIKSNEDMINHTKRYYIPKDEIEAKASKIKSGDIIAITTSKTGLDYAHTGIAYKEKGKALSMIHASSKKKEVVIEDNLISYLMDIKSDTGISVLRPIGD